MTVRTMRRATVAFGLAFVLASSAAAVAAWVPPGGTNRHAYAKFGNGPAAIAGAPVPASIRLVGTNNVLDPGDAIVFTFNEPMDVTTFNAAWNGAGSFATTVNIVCGVNPTVSFPGSQRMGGVAFTRPLCSTGGGSQAAWNVSLAAAWNGSRMTMTFTSKASGGASVTVASSTTTWTSSTSTLSPQVRDTTGTALAAPVSVNVTGGVF